ncbi:hypothetical protein [Haloferula sp.]|uniref:BatD family protein n=1 Tax=Haloferula sp. TaxID=2497595 RepID=UPI00329F0989
MPLFIEIRTNGTFSGAASFDLPEIPRTVIIKIGSPVISSENEGDTEFFTQRHEFALFSQADGTLKLPPITARFSHHKGYSGPTFDTSTDTEAATLTIRRPPDSSDLGFLVTTDSLDIEESWDPTPGPLETGAVLKRTIVQRAEQLTGIALKPAPTPEIDGIRTYPGNPEVSDKTERGEFLGERRETVTYLVQQPGLHTLPEIRFDWWNPATETLESLTLPAVSFSATAPPPPPVKPSPARFLWLIIPVAFLIIIIALRGKILNLLRSLHDWIDPPPRRAAREFIKACKTNKPVEAASAWSHYRRIQTKIALTDDLKEEIRSLHSQLYGPSEGSSGWSGQALATAFQQSLKNRAGPLRPDHLPQLNP